MTAALRDRLNTLLLVAGVVVLVYGATFTPPTLDYDAMREWNRCKQERRMATLNDSYTFSQECRDLLGRTKMAYILFPAGFGLLVAARLVKKGRIG